MQRQEWDKIHELKTGASIQLADFTVLKVPNGWIYYYHERGTFVPDTLKINTNHTPSGETGPG